MRAYVYARYSSNLQREESISAQLEACRDYAKREAVDITRVFTDEAESARFDDRPGFQDMIDAVRRDPPDLVLVHKLDRFSRNRYDAAIYRRRLKEHGVRLVSVLEPLDDSPESVILESVLEGMAEYYSRNLAREVMKGLRQSALQGLWCGGRPPIGYAVGPGRKLVIEPEGAETVRRIFSMFLEGYGYASIALALNREGRRTAAGGPWHKSSIYTVLTNEKYVGVYLFNKRIAAREDGSRNNHRYKSDDEIIRIEGGVPAIVDRETWEGVQTKLKSRLKGPQPRRNTGNYYLLTGLIYCGICGGPIVGKGLSKGGYRYVCNRKATQGCDNPSIGKDWIESKVLAELKARVLNEAAIDELVPVLLREIQKRTVGYGAEHKEVLASIADAEVRISRLLDMIEDGSAGADVSRRIDQRRAELNALRERELFLKDRESVKYNKSMVRRYLQTFCGQLESDDPVIKRKILETFVERVEVFPDRVDLRFIISPAMAGCDSVGGEWPNRPVSPSAKSPGGCDSVGGEYPNRPLSHTLLSLAGSIRRAQTKAPRQG